MANSFIFKLQTFRDLESYNREEKIEIPGEIFLIDTQLFYSIATYTLHRIAYANHILSLRALLYIHVYVRDYVSFIYV